MSRGDYSRRVRELFAATDHGGDLPPGFGNVFGAEASESTSGARVVLTAAVADGRIVALRYRVFGCPHLVAALERWSERYEGAPTGALASFSVAETMRELDVPIEKTGRILLLEDAIRSLAAAIAANQTRGS